MKLKFVTVEEKDFEVVSRSLVELYWTVELMQLYKLDFEMRLNQFA